jgi:hypothetical protein
LTTNRRRPTPSLHNTSSSPEVQTLGFRTGGATFCGWPFYNGPDPGQPRCLGPVYGDCSVLSKQTWLRLSTGEYACEMSDRQYQELLDCLARGFFSVAIPATCTALGRISTVFAASRSRSTTRPAARRPGNTVRTHEWKLCTNKKCGRMFWTM